VFGKKTSVNYLMARSDVSLPDFDANVTILSALYKGFSIGPNLPPVSCRTISKGDFKSPSAETSGWTSVAMSQGIQGLC